MNIVPTADLDALEGASSSHAAMLADYLAGHDILAITTEHGVSRSTLYRAAKKAGLAPRKRGPVGKSKCQCGARTSSKTGLCALCRLALPPVEPPEDEDGLGEGQWVFDRRTRIMRWDPYVPPPLPEKRSYRSRDELAECGTELGYWWHRYNDRDNWPLPNDDPCGCRAAHREHQAALRREQNGDVA